MGFAAVASTELQIHNLSDGSSNSKKWALVDDDKFIIFILRQHIAKKQP